MAKIEQQRRGADRWLARLAAAPRARSSCARRGRGPGRPSPSASSRRYLTVIVVLPIAALVWASTKDGGAGFWDVVSSPEAVAALKLTLVVAALAALVNAVLGTITAWVLVRDDFRGKRS